jgi:hypothetical protein
VATKNELESKDDKIYYKYLKFFLIIFIVLFSMKHFARIYKNYSMKYINYPWPQFHSQKQNDGIFKSEPITNNGMVTHYLLKSDDGCGYSISPCGGYDIKKINFSVKRGYKFYNLVK